MPEYQVTIAKPEGRAGFGPKIKGVFSPCGREAELAVLERYPMLRVADVCRMPSKLDDLIRDKVPFPFQLHKMREP